MKPIEILKRHPLMIGILLMFVLTWPLYAQLGLFVGHGVGLAALIMTGFTLGRGGIGALLRRFLIWRVEVRWYLVVLGGPVLLHLIAIGLMMLMGGGSPDFATVPARQIFGTSGSLWFFIVPFFLVDAVTNGEELGWRGYVLPRLQARFSPLVSSLILGAVWGLWHLPKFWAAGVGEAFALAVAHAVAVAVLYTWIYNSTGGSLLIATLFHAATNTAYVFLMVAPAGLTLTPSAVKVCVEVVAALAVIAATGQSLLRPPAPVSGLKGEVPATESRGA